RHAIDEAVTTLLKNEIDIAMYPQGTRALANTGLNGERLDAGYYTTGTANSLKKELGHLKKGCAYLALDTAMALSKMETPLPLHLVFIAIDGVATILPKGAFRIQTEGQVAFRVGDLYTINPGELPEIRKPDGEEAVQGSEKRYVEMIDEIQSKIDGGLVKALRLHENLLNRFQEGMRRSDFVLKSDQFKLSRQLSSALKNGERLPFVILDRLFALPSKKQADYLKQLSIFILTGRDLKSLRNEITDELFWHRGKELRTMIQQEQAKKSA
ncbi:MAG: hypothetical protein HYY44_06370, partial [Deltaproteobacteria bacterium]|nr:hypothetical protein [Deltaproteobacteria bacterium]